MKFTHLFLAASTGLLATLSTACANVPADTTITAAPQSADLSTLMQSPQKASDYNYCVWAYQQDGKAQALPNYDTALDRKTTTLSPDAWTATALVDAGSRIAQASKSEKACNKTFTKGRMAFDKKMKKSLKRHWADAKYEKKVDPKIAAVQETMAKHWVEDQAARRVYLASRTEDKLGSAYWTRRLAGARTGEADKASTAYMKALLNDYDWIDNKRFGKRVSMAAWLMVQHADDHVDLQKLALERMTPYVETGGVDKSDYAFLWDRVAVNTNKPQRYGTQPTWECTPEGNLTLQPLEQPETVNERRAEMGMDTVEQGLAEMSRSVCG